MIEIILRELMDHFKSLRFIVLLLFSIALFSMNGFVFVQRFSKHIDSYNEKTANKYTSTYSTQIVNKPSLLQFITEGGDKYQPEAYNLHPKGWVEPSHITAAHNYMMPDIPDIDWTFIIGGYPLNASDRKM